MKTFYLKTQSETVNLDPRDNFLVYGGAGSGKTASIGKPLMEEFIKNNWAGFIYDYKDFDYTKTAYNLCQKYNYPYKFYYISFTDMSRTYRFNPLDKKVVEDEALLQQVMDDFLKSMLPIDGKTDEWYQGALGILKGVAIRFFNFKGDWEKYCTLPHILNFILLADAKQLLTFLEGDDMAKKAASAFISTQSSDINADESSVSTLNNYISLLAKNRNVCYVLSGDDFIFNLTDPQDPKLFAISNNFALESIIFPIIAMLLPLSARKIEFESKVEFAFILDEMTTFKVNNFQCVPSILCGNYKVSFLILSQSIAKFAKLYGKEGCSLIEGNCANIFLGRTKDVEALKYYPLFFGNEELDKEEVFNMDTFTDLEPGEFILSTGEADSKRLKSKFEMFKLKEEPLPIVRLTTKEEIEENYEQINIDCQKIIDEICRG